MSKPNRIPGHAFLSYVPEDARRVDKLQRSLENAGIRVWRDTVDLWPGEDWHAKIRDAIADNALVFIICFSQASLAHDKNRQNEELLLAIEQQRLRRQDASWLVPVRFDECDIPAIDIGGGRSLRSITCADVFDDHFDEGAFRLVTAILRNLGRHSNDDLSGDSGDSGNEASKARIGIEHDGAAPSVSHGPAKARLRQLNSWRIRPDWLTAIATAAIALTGAAVAIVPSLADGGTSTPRSVGSSPTSQAGYLPESPLLSGLGVPHECSGLNIPSGDWIAFETMIEGQCPRPGNVPSDLYFSDGIIYARSSANLSIPDSQMQTRAACKGAAHHMAQIDVDARPYHTVFCYTSRDVMAAAMIMARNAHHVSLNVVGW